jgi:hypothetical protein
MRRDRLTTYLYAALAIGLVGCAVGLFFDARAAGAAWLLAIFLAMGLSAGALSLLLTGRLTGGAWIAALEPALRPMAALVPLVGVAFIPLLFMVPALYPWAAEGAHDHLVGLFYLNWPLLIFRLVLAFAGWSLAAFVIVDIPGPRGQVFAGLALIFHVVMTTFLAYDWMLALQPAFTSSAFGTFTCILFLMSALCLGVLIVPLPERPLRDVAGLIIAASLAVIYIGFMQFLIIWYGNLPETAKFYLYRDGPVATTALIAALVAGGLLPIALLLPSRARQSMTRVRLAGACGLIGIALHWGWCALAMFGAAAVAISVFALLAVFSAFALALERARTEGLPLLGRPADG